LETPEEQGQQPAVAAEQKSGVPGLKAPNPDDLPREYLTPEEQAERDRKDGLYGDFTKDREEQVKGKIEKKEDAALDWIKRISAKAGEDMAYYAGKTSFEFEFDDGRVERYDRVSPIDYQWNELEDLRAEVEGREAMDDGHKLSRREHRLKEHLLEDLKAKYYLINAKSRQPMTADIKAHVMDSDRLACILDAMIICSLHKTVTGKK